MFIVLYDILFELITMKQDPKQLIDKSSITAYLQTYKSIQQLYADKIFVNS